MGIKNKYLKEKSLTKKNSLQEHSLHSVNIIVFCTDLPRINLRTIKKLTPGIWRTINKQGMWKITGKSKKTGKLILFRICNFMKLSLKLNSKN